MFLHVIICFVCVQDSWEIVEGLRGGLGNVQPPERQEGFMLKRRKWPMKGWHKVSVCSKPLTGPCSGHFHALVLIKSTTFCTVGFN